MRRTSLILIPLLCSLLGCLAPRRKADFEADLRSWVGRPASAFMAAKQRQPTGVTELPQGGRVYLFEATNFSTPDQNGAYPGFTTRTTHQLNCRLILETDTTGTITRTRWEGNNCW